MLSWVVNPRLRLRPAPPRRFFFSTHSFTPSGFREGPLTTNHSLPKPFACHTYRESRPKSNHCHRSENPPPHPLCLPHSRAPPRGGTLSFPKSEALPRLEIPSRSEKDE